MASLMMLLTAVDAGLGACFFGIAVERIPVYREAFGVPEEFTPIGASRSATAPSRRGTSATSASRSRRPCTGAAGVQ